MKRIHIAGGLLCAAVTTSMAQAPTLPQTLPPNTVVGRLGIGPGPAQAIPITALFSQGIAGTPGTIFNTVGTVAQWLPSATQPVVIGQGAEGGLCFSTPGLTVDITTGTNAAPITTAGPSLHVARTEDLAVATCTLFNNNECNSAIYGFSQNITSGASAQQLTGVMGGALTYSTNGTGEAVGVQGLGRAVGASIAGVAGAYFEGRYDSTAVRSYYYTVGVEGRSNNQTGVDSTFNTTDGNSFNSFLASSSATSGVAGKANGAFVAAAGGGGSLRFNAGLILTSGCCDRGIWMSLFNSQQAYFGSAGTADSVVAIDNLAGSHQTTVDFQDAGTVLWRIGKLANNTFYIFDQAANKIALDISTGGNLAFGTPVVLTQATPSAVPAMQVGLGITTAAAAACGSLAGAAGCLVINVGGTFRNVPYY